jgi:hypothetical protein
MPLRFRPDPELSAAAPLVSRRLHERAALLDGAWFRSAQAALPRGMIGGAFTRCGAHEGTLWLVQEDMLVPAVNTGPHADRLVDVFRQPIAHGIIGMVAVTEQAFCENDIRRNALRDATLDTLLGVETVAMLAVPMVFGGGVRGVVTCVQLRDDRPAPGFTPAHLEDLERETGIAGRLIDLTLLDSILGLQSG